MPNSWKITEIGSSAALREGSASDIAQAWRHAAIALVEVLTAGEIDRCAVVIDDGPPAFLIAGRTDEGHVDLPDARAATGRLAVAASGWPFC